MATDFAPNSGPLDVSDDELVVSTTGLPPIGDAPTEPSEAAQLSLTPDEEAGDGWIATEIES